MKGVLEGTSMNLLLSISLGVLSHSKICGLRGGFTLDWFLSTVT